MLFLRSFLFQAYWWIMSAIMTISHVPLFLAPRRWTSHQIKMWGRFSLWGLRTIVGIHVEIRGQEYIPKSGAIVASKHQTMWETIALFNLNPDPAIIFKGELTYVPFYGWYAMKAGMILIDRGTQAKAMRKMIKQGKAAISEDRQIVVFPEGTRRPVGAPAEYKSGVYGLYGQLKVPCVPVAHNSGLHWPRRGYIWKPGKIIIEFLPPIAPGLKRQEFMKTLEETIETATDRLVTEGRK